METKNMLLVLDECASACNHCLTECLNEKDVEMMKECIRLDLDCMQICRITADFVARRSDHAEHLIKECMEICSKCAQECEKHPMKHCQKCAEACRKCAQACQAFHKEGVHEGS